MNIIRYPFLSLAIVMLAACSGSQSPGGRVILLVLIPTALILALLYFLFRRRPNRRSGRGPRYPDYDDRE